MILERVSAPATVGIASHRVPRFLRSVGHRPPDHGAGQDQYTADTVDVAGMLDQLSATRTTLGRLAELTDRQLDAIPPNGSFRFCDGRRTLEQVLASLLKHQGHQIDALTAVIAEAPSTALTSHGIGVTPRAVRGARTAALA